MKKFICLLLLSGSMINLYAQSVMQGIPEVRNGKWLTRFNQEGARKIFDVTTSSNGIKVSVNKYDPDTLQAYVFVHLKLAGPVSEIEFDYHPTGNMTKMPIALLDAGGNILWKYDAENSASTHVTLKNIKARGQIVFKIAKAKGEEI